MELTGRNRWIALIVVCIGDLMIVLDATIVNVALPSIQDDLGFSQESLAWVANAYLLTFGGFMLLGGRLGDLFGGRRVFLIGLTLFTAASLACGLAELAGVARHRPCDPGRRRRDRGRDRARAADEALHRAGRAREGDGRLRLRRLGRRHARRAARRRAHRRVRTGTGSSSSTSRSGSPSSSARLFLLPKDLRGRGARRPGPRRRGHRDRRADARGLRDRERPGLRLGVAADARPARRRRRAARRLRR